MPKKNEISYEEMFEALSRAGELYGKYIEIQETCSACVEPEILDDYSRDMSHPLNLVVKD